MCEVQGSGGEGGGDGGECRGLVVWRGGEDDVKRIGEWLEGREKM